MNSITSANRVGRWEYEILTQKLYWNSEQFLIYGYIPNQEYINPEFFLQKTTHHSDLRRVENIINSALEKEEGYNFVRKTVRRDGSIGLAETIAKIIREENGQAKSIIGLTEEFIVPGSIKNHLQLEKQPILRKVESFIEERPRDPENNECEQFKEYFVNYKDAVFNIVRRIVPDHDAAADLTQETFIKAWINFSKFNSDKGSFYTWLNIIAKNNCKDYFKSKGFNKSKITLPLEDVIYLNPDNSEAKDFSDDLLSTLSPEKREIVQMIYINGYSQQELAELTNVKLGTIKSRSRKAIGEVKKMLARRA